MNQKVLVQDLLIFGNPSPWSHLKASFYKMLQGSELCPDSCGFSQNNCRLIRNIQLLPASTLHRNSLSSPYLYSPHDISEKKSRPLAKLTHSFPWQRSRVSTHSALLALAGSSHSLAPAIPGGYVAILDDVMSVQELGHSLSWTTEKPEPGPMQRQGFIFFF